MEKAQALRIMGTVHGRRVFPSGPFLSQKKTRLSISQFPAFPFHFKEVIFHEAPSRFLTAIPASPARKAPLQHRPGRRPLSHRLCHRFCRPFHPAKTDRHRALHRHERLHGAGNPHGLRRLCRHRGGPHQRGGHHRLRARISRCRNRDNHPPGDRGDAGRLDHPGRCQPKSG